MTDLPSHPQAFELDSGLVLRGTSWGGHGRDPVLLLHGGGQTHHAWDRAVPDLLRAGWRAVGVDLRGHGQSDRCPASDYTIDTLAADVVALVEALGPRTVVVGASVSGIAALLAAGGPLRERLRALVVVDITPTVAQTGVERILGFMRSHLESGFGSLQEAAEAIAAYLPHRRPPASLAGLGKNLRLHDDGRYRWHWDPAFVAGDKWAAVEPHRERLLAAARRIRCPTLLVRGRHSDVVTPAAAREFQELVPHARYADVNDAGHMLAGDSNDVFAGRVLEFLRELP